MTRLNIAIEARFLTDIESGVGPVRTDPREASLLLTTYALLLRHWREQCLQLRKNEIEPDALVNGGTVVYLTIILKRAWSLARRKHPDFMETPLGEQMSRVLDKMYDVVITASGGHSFLEAQRTIFEAMVDDLRGRGEALNPSVVSCFDDTDIETVDLRVFLR